MSKTITCDHCGAELPAEAYPCAERPTIDGETVWVTCSREEGGKRIVEKFPADCLMAVPH